MTAAALLLVVKVSLVLGAALVAAWLTRRAPAQSRHRLWSGVFAAVLLLPLVGAAVPALRVPLPSWAAAPQPSADPVVVVNVEKVVTSDVLAISPPGSSRADAPLLTTAEAAGYEAPREPLSTAQVIAGIWSIGAIAALGALAIALLRVARLSRTAEPLSNPDWHAQAAVFGKRLGLSAPVTLLASPHVTTPMAGGLLRPTIFLPEAAAEWSAKRRDVVLAHEIVHLAGRDPLRQIITRLAVALYWFHPLAWLAARLSNAAREQACDEAVIALGTRPSTYARVLLDFAEGMRPSRAPLAALPIVQRTLLEKRLMAILNDDTRPATRHVALVFAALAALTLSVAAAQPRGIDSRDVEQQGSGVVAGNISQGVATDVRSGVPTGVMSGVPTGVRSGVPTGVMSGVPTGVMSGVPTGVMSGVPTGVRSGVPTGVMAGVPAGVMSGVIPGVETVEQDLACDGSRMGSFRGSYRISEQDGRTVVNERVGWRNHDVIIQKQFGDLRICAIAEGLPQDKQAPVKDWPAAATRVVFETQEPGQTRRMEIAGSTTTWFVNGQPRPIDAEATEWRTRLIELMEPVWELSRLRGEVSSLRGNISSILGQRSSLQGEISSLRGRISSMQGEISSLRGRESSLRGEISSIRGQLSSLEGRISSERGAISSLESRRWNASAADEARIVEAIKQHQARIREIEKEVAAFNADAKVQEVERRIVRAEIDRKVEEAEKRIRDFDIERKVDEVESRIVKLEVDRRIAEIERQITSLNADQRARALEARIEAALKRLRDR